MSGEKPLECPCCGSAATVEPHLIEAGYTVGDQTWTDWWTASVNCTSCPLQFIAGGDTEEEAVRNAVEGWNRRVTDRDFAMAVHDGNLWGKCSECTERRGYYLDAETIQRQQEHIAELRAEKERVVSELGAELVVQAKKNACQLAERDELIRDMLRDFEEQMHGQTIYPQTWYVAQKIRAQKLGIEVDDEG